MKLHERIAPKAGEGLYHAIIEIPALQSSVKYEYDPALGCFTVDRFMQTALRYPCNYGFIPQTLAGDGDPIDVLLVTPEPILPMAVIAVRPIGVLVMEDEKGPDEKILCVADAKADPSHAHIHNYTDLPSLFLAQLKHFFEHYKDLDKGKWVKVQDFKDASVALQLIEASLARYTAK